MKELLKRIIEVSGDLSHAIFMEEWQQVKNWGKELDILVELYKLESKKDENK